MNSEDVICNYIFNGGNERLCERGCSHMKPHHKTGSCGEWVCDPVGGVNVRCIPLSASRKFQDFDVDDLNYMKRLGVNK